MSGNISLLQEATKIKIVKYFQLKIDTLTAQGFEEAQTKHMAVPVMHLYRDDNLIVNWIFSNVLIYS